MRAAFPRKAAASGPGGAGIGAALTACLIASISIAPLLNPDCSCTAMSAPRRCVLLLADHCIPPPEGTSLSAEHCLSPHHLHAFCIPASYRRVYGLSDKGQGSHGQLRHAGASRGPVEARLSSNFRIGPVSMERVAISRPRPRSPPLAAIPGSLPSWSSGRSALDTLLARSLRTTPTETVARHDGSFEACLRDRDCDQDTSQRAGHGETD